MTRKLKNIISDLYEIFAKYHGGNIEGSPIYDDLAMWNKEITSKPLKNLTSDDLSRFVGKSITTWGDENDLKHFLPRILELTAEFQTPYEIWILFEKLSLAKWEKWTENEQTLVHDYMIELWRELLNNDSQNAEWEFKDYFSTIAHFYPNFSELLNVWSDSNSKSSIKFLSNYIFQEKTVIFDRNKISGFYDKTENAFEFQSWLVSDRIIEKLQESYFEYEKESFAEKISWAEQIVTTEKRIKTALNTLYI
jgi:hypothetical protein